MKATSFPPRLLSIVPLLLVLIGLNLLVWTMPGVLRGQHNASIRDTPASTPALDPADISKRIADLQRELDDLTRARDGLKERLDSISRDAATAQWLLAMVLGVAGLLTLAQGVFAFFSAQNYVKQADDAIRRANEAVTKADTAVKEATGNAGSAVARIDALAADVRTKYPMFTDIESARTEAFNQLSSLTPALDDDQNLYAQSDPLMRQRIFAIESFSAIQFLTPASGSTELLRNLRLLGKFYAGKFAAERQWKSDFERSEYYFELALEKFGRPFSVLNDIAWLFSTVANPTDPDRARSALEESLRRKPNQQRALFNLGTIVLDRGDQGKLDMSRKLLLQAAQQPNWEDTPNPSMASHITYNLACVYDALAGLKSEPAEAQKLLDQSMDCFESAARIGFQPRLVVESDLKDGDLSNLARSAAHADRLRAALMTYEIAWQRLH